MTPSTLPPPAPVAHSSSRPVSLARTGWWWGGLATVTVVALLYHRSLTYLGEEWILNEDYGHAMFVPLISAVLIWWRRDSIRAAGFSPSWWGVLPVVMGILLFLLGDLATLYVLQHLSLWCVIVGVSWAALGGAAVRAMAFPLGYLLAMIPPPHLLQQSLSSWLQLVSSSLGVGCLQLIGVTAFREGNVIDLGPIQLQVVEACSGLRYLFPLLALTILIAYLYKEQWWQRLFLVASAAPLAVLLNGLRIGVIGLLVEVFGTGAAEGFIHAFEGWFLFLLSLGVLWGEVRLLSWIQPRTSSAESQPPVLLPLRRSAAMVVRGGIGAPAIVALLLLTGTTLLSWKIAGREEAPPPRQNFLSFPMHLANQQGTPIPMERQYLDALRFDDYVLADYAGGSGQVNVYVAYYRSQKSGQATHSPKTCIPGGGWEIADLDQVDVPIEQPGAGPLRVNRVWIQKAAQKQIVLYWFKQRERIVTSEYWVKAFLLWDAVTRGRTDGALVRVSGVVRPGESSREAEARVIQMAAAVHPVLKDYVPD